MRSSAHLLCIIKVQSVPLLVGKVLVCNPISFLLDFFPSSCRTQILWYGPINHTKRQLILSYTLSNFILKGELGLGVMLHLGG